MKFTQAVTFRFFPKRDRVIGWALGQLTEKGGKGV
jgi:hypothetical protein